MYSRSFFQWIIQTIDLKATEEFKYRLAVPVVAWGIEYCNQSYFDNSHIQHNFSTIFCYVQTSLLEIKLYLLTKFEGLFESDNYKDFSLDFFRIRFKDQIVCSLDGRTMNSQQIAHHIMDWLAIDLNPSLKATRPGLLKNDKLGRYCIDIKSDDLKEWISSTFERTSGTSNFMHFVKRQKFYFTSSVSLYKLVEKVKIKVILWVICSAE